MAEHQLDIVQESIDPVVPSDDAHLRHPDDESGKGGGVVVDQLEDVHPSVGAHDQS